jgi:hypothetical protein
VAGVTVTTYTPRPDIAAHGPIPGIDYHVALGYYPVTETDTVTSRWDVAHWDDTSGSDAGEWEGDPPLDDITCNVISVQVAEGRDLPLDRFRPGACTVVVNDPDGKYSPWLTAGEPDAFGVIRVGIDLVAWVDIAGTSSRRFTGIVDTIVDGFDTDGSHTVTFHANDYLSLLAAYDGTEQPPVGAGELTGARLTRILTNAGYVGDTTFDTGSVALQETTLARNALDESGVAVDTEMGAYWCDRDGVLVFRDRNGLVDDPHYTDVQAIFGDRDSSGDDEICYAEITLQSDTAKVQNIVSIANTGGTAVTRSDLTSVSLYRPRTHQRFDLIHVDPAESPVIAQRHLDFYAYAANRVDGLTVDLATLTPAQRVAVLDLDVLWRVEVRRRPVGFQVVTEVQIQGMTEHVTADQWTIEFSTFSADAVFDVGRWNTDLWDTGLWGY